MTNVRTAIVTVEILSATATIDEINNFLASTPIFFIPNDRAASFVGSLAPRVHTSSNNGSEQPVARNAFFVKQGVKLHVLTPDKLADYGINLDESHSD